MKISLKKYGGLAAGIRRPTLSLDSSIFSAESQEQLHHLVAAVKAASNEANTQPGRARDSMGYTIEIQDDDGAPTVLTESDSTKSSTFAALLRWIEDYHH